MVYPLWPNHRAADRFRDYQANLPIVAARGPRNRLARQGDWPIGHAPHGEFIEVHEELSPEKKWTLTQHEQPGPVAIPAVDKNGIPAPGGIKAKLRARMSAANAEQIPAPTETEVKELESGHH